MRRDGGHESFFSENNFLIFFGMNGITDFTNFREGAKVLDAS